MYSKEVESLLKSKGVSPGDSIEITSSKGKFSGVLLPRPDLGDESIIVLKLDNGYNIGIKFDKLVEVKKLDVPKKSFSFPKAKIEADSSLPKVSVIAVGGTILNKIDYRTGGVYPLAKVEELLYDMPELTKIASIKPIDLMGVASEDMTHKEWAEIAKSVSNELNHGARGVVILIGTDAMHYVSAALSFMLKDLSGPVILTGAQRSGDRGSSDAFMNLRCSVILAAKSDIAEVGICMHADPSDEYCNFMLGTKVRKMHTSRRDAFRAINCAPIAKVSHEGSIKYLSEYRKIDNKKKPTSTTDFEQKVALVKFYPGADPDILNYYMKNGYKGIILEGTGLGHTSMSWIESIKKIIDSGIVVGMTSQTIYGRVNDKVYSTLRRLAATGVIYCEDMLPEVAVVKLGFLLGNYKKDEAKELLNKNVAGEITKRSGIDDEYFE